MLRLSILGRPFPGVAAGLILAAAAFGAAWAATSVFDWNYYSQPLQQLMGGSPIALPVLVLLGIVNGTYEEMFLLGFLLRGLRGYGLSIAIGVSVLVRVPVSPVPRPTWRGLCRSIRPRPKPLLCREWKALPGCLGARPLGHHSLCLECALI